MIIIINSQEPLTNQTELSFADLSRAPSSAMFSLSSTWSFKIKINYFFFNFKSSTWPGFLFPTISSFCISPVQATPATLSSKILLEISPSRWFAWGLRPAAHIWQNFGLIGKSWTIGHISLYQNLFSKHLRSCVVNLEGNLTSAAWLASQSGGYLIQDFLESSSWSSFWSSPWPDQIPWKRVSFPLFQCQAVPYRRLHIKPAHIYMYLRVYAYFYW